MRSPNLNHMQVRTPASLPIAILASLGGAAWTAAQQGAHATNLSTLLTVGGFAFTAASCVVGVRVGLETLKVRKLQRKALEKQLLKPQDVEI